MSKNFSSNEKTLKELMEEYIRTPGIRKQYLKIVIKTAWEQEMGPMVVKYTRGMTLRNGVLQIKITSAPLRQEILLNKLKIIAMLNKVIQEELIKDLLIT